MRRYSLYTIVFGVFAVLIVVSFVSIYFSVSSHRKDFLETAIEEKINLAATMNETVLSPLWAYRTALTPGGIVEKTFIEGMVKFRDVRYIRMVKIDGNIFASSIEEEWGKTIEEPAIAQAIQTKKPIIRDEIFNEEKIKTIIYPGYQDKTIWVGFSLKSVEKTVRAILIRDVVIALGVLMFTILAVFIILRIIIGPLKKMTVACQEIKKGKLDVQINVKSKTEIGELALTFNEMIKELKVSRATLEESKATLEVQVRARTKELRELTENLEAEVKRRTKEVYEKMEELERFNKLSVGREMKMIELKEEIKKLKEEINKLNEK